MEAELATIDCPIVGDHTLTVTGWGTLEQDGVNTGSGGTDLEGGTLQLGPGATLGSGSLTVNDATLDLNGQSLTVSSLKSTTRDGLITNYATAAATLTVDQTSNSAYFGSIQDGNGPVSLALVGNGTLVASGYNAFTGDITITSGTVIVPNRELAADNHQPDRGEGRDVHLRSCRVEPVDRQRPSVPTTAAGQDARRGQHRRDDGK